MNRSELIAKYTGLSKGADKRLDGLHAELRATRALKNLDDSGWEELSDYLDAKDEHIHQKRVCQIYGQFCADLGDV